MTLRECTHNSYILVHSLIHSVYPTSRDKVVTTLAYVTCPIFSISSYMSTTMKRRASDDDGTCPHVETAGTSLAPPSFSQSVYKDDCMWCFDSPVRKTWSSSNVWIVKVKS